MIRLWADVRYRLTRRQSEGDAAFAPRSASPASGASSTTRPSVSPMPFPGPLPHGVCVVDAGGVITDVNAALARMTGFAPGRAGRVARPAPALARGAS